jgi:hypothetical protein
MGLGSFRRDAGGIGSGQIGGVGPDQNGRRLNPPLGRLADTLIVWVGHIVQRVNSAVREVADGHSRDRGPPVRGEPRQVQASS